MEPSQQSAQPSTPSTSPPPVQPVTPVEEQSKTLLYVIIGILVLLILGVGSYLVYDRFLSGDADNCVDSNEQCEGKPDGTSCTTGVWCDTFGNVCGGQSCVGMGTGFCENEQCVMQSEVEEEEQGEQEEVANSEEQEAEDPYGDWETYTDAVFSYSFEYPANYSVEIEDEGGEIDSRTVKVKNTEDQTIVSLLSARYFGAGGYSGNIEYYDIRDEFDVEGWTMYSYDCADLGYGYYDESAVKWFDRTPGTCFQLYEKNLEEEGIDDSSATILHIYAENFPSIFYGSADRLADFTPTQQDFDNARLIIESLENFLIERD